MNRTIKYFLLVFLVALCIRIFFIHTMKHYVEGDGAGRYVPLAVEMYQGNIGEALQKTISPLYPIFLYSIYSIFDSCQEPFIQKSSPIQMQVMYVQAFFGSLACAIYFLSFFFLLRINYALVTSFAVALYMPLAVWTTLQIRSEILSFFLISIIVFIGVFISKQNKSITINIFLAVSLAFSNFLILLNHRMYLGLALFISIYFIFFPRQLDFGKRLLQIIFPFVFAFILFFFIFNSSVKINKPIEKSILGYNLIQSIMKMNSILIHKGIFEKPLYYEDSNGQCFLPEQMSIIGLSDDDNLYSLERIKEWPERDDKILRKWALKLIFSYPVHFFFTSIYRVHMVWVEDLWVKQKRNGPIKLTPSEDYRAEGKLFFIVLSHIGYIFGFFGILGILFSFKKTLPFLVILIYVISLLSVLHTHRAYALSVHPIIILYSFIFLFSVYNRFRYKFSQKEKITSIWK